MEPSTMTADEMREITRLHATLEQQGDYDPLLATLVDEPIFEFHPPGGQLRGGQTLRDYYVRFLRDFMPLVEETILIGEWPAPRRAFTSTAGHESMTAREPSTHGSIYGSGKPIGGERLYGSAGLMDLCWRTKEQLVPIDGPTPWAMDMEASNRSRGASPTPPGRRASDTSREDAIQRATTSSLASLEGSNHRGTAPNTSIIMR